MNNFIDPRTNPSGSIPPRSLRTTTEADMLEDLYRLCREGRLYDVERWIQQDRPLQLTKEAAANLRGRYKSALRIGLEQGNQALILLLLCNGYDPNGEAESPLSLALRSRRFDLVDLLLEWGADPHQVDPDDLFGTYRSDLFECFHELGVDLTADHAVAYALAYHTSNKPLFGFARRHRREDPRFQMELNIALAHHAGNGNKKGVSLCLWAGADPHVPVPSLRYGGSWVDEDDETDEADRFVGFSAINEACRSGNVEILERLAPDPSLDDFEDLYQAAGGGAVVEFLAKSRLPEDVGPLIQHHLWWLGFDSREWRPRDVIERLFEVGARWENGTKENIAGVRHAVLKASDYSFVALLRLLAKSNYCSPEVLQELARTPAMRRRMKKVGFIPSPQKKPGSDEIRPTGSREVLKKCGIEIPRPKIPLPRRVTIGRRRPNATELHLSREQLFKRVWSTPVSKLAQEWGLSDRGLGKACRKLQVPVPPRGYWAKVEAGKRVKRAQLSKLPPGEAEVIVVWALLPKRE